MRPSLDQTNLQTTFEEPGISVPELLSAEMQTNINTREGD